MRTNLCRSKKAQALIVLPTTCFLITTLNFIITPKRHVLKSHFLPYGVDRSLVILMYLYKYIHKLYSI